MTGKLRNDCFALPRGVNWTPVADALSHLETSLTAISGVEPVELARAGGRILAEDVSAPRAHPPFANSAVDGYAFRHAPGRTDFRLLEGRAAAGEPFTGEVGEGAAVRILTGARIPQGADTVVLQEDVTKTSDGISFEDGLKAGANIRAAGEDVAADQIILKKGQLLGAGDIGLAASVGLGELPVRTRLKVAVISTGSEVAEAGSATSPDQIFDANRPMLKALLSAWGAEVVDLGRMPDVREQVISALDAGARQADVIVTSGGASAGDEDHISAVLRESGQLETWRIALKPGRPLAMGLWSGVPVFGLPGNPVAAFVCSLLFVKPSLGVLGGTVWRQPLGYDLVANFDKNKKPGREEYLRARRSGGSVEVFKSEGSGRVSGLSWADGLVALEHDRGPVSVGDTVRYIPFTEFGL